MQFFWQKRRSASLSPHFRELISYGDKQREDTFFLSGFVPYQLLIKKERAREREMEWAKWQPIIAQATNCIFDCACPHLDQGWAGVYQLRVSKRWTTRDPYGQREIRELEKNGENLSDLVLKAVAIMSFRLKMVKKLHRWTKKNKSIVVQQQNFQGLERFWGGGNGCLDTCPFSFDAQCALVLHYMLTMWIHLSETLRNDVKWVVHYYAKPTDKEESDSVLQPFQIKS